MGEKRSEPPVTTAHTMDSVPSSQSTAEVWASWKPDDRPPPLPELKRKQRKISGNELRQRKKKMAQLRNKKLLKRIMRRHIQTFRVCANNFLCRNMIVAHFVVQGGKLVSEPKFKLLWKDDPPDELYPCISNALKQIQFPDSDGRVDVCYPLHYSCSSD